MKKLFKEVWKSFSKSKVILVGLIILIFLTSGIITLIFDVTNSYKSEFNTYKKASVLQDVTMNSNLSLYGSSPSIYYGNNNDNNQINYRNTDNLVETQQWTHDDERNNYVDYIEINTKSEFINLKTVVPSLTKDLYVKVKDLSNLLNSNLNLGQINPTDTDKVKATLFPTGNNQLNVYSSPSEDSIISVATTVSQISNLYDTYDANSQAWTASGSPKSLFTPASNNYGGTFGSILIDKDTEKAYVKSVLIANKTSQEYIKYESDNSSFIEISSDDVKTMLGFTGNGTFLSSYKLDTKKTWILDDEITNYTNGMSAKQFFAQSNLPNLKNPFDLLTPVTIDWGKITNVSIPSSWFVYSKYKYIFTKNTLYLHGISADGTIDNSWSGYYKEYLEHLKTSDPDRFNSLYKTSYWTKDVVIAKVDYNGNEIKETDANGEPIENSNNQTMFENILLSNSDLTMSITNTTDSQVSTIAKLEGVTNIGDNTATDLSLNRTADNEDFINTQAKDYKYLTIYNELRNIVGKMGIRETLTTNSIDNNETKVYQFINLGNNLNEINWNGINIKQEVGKLIDTKVSESSIFNLPSNINAKTKSVPQEYVAPIINQLLTGLSLDRTYINPMISFNNFTYTDSETQAQNTVSSAKIVWTTKNGIKDLDDVFGISTIRDKTNGTKVFYILKRDSSNSLNWNAIQSFNSYDQFASYISSNQLNFAPFDIDGNDLTIVSDKGWIRQDTNYSDKYAVPFQYLLPNSDMINDFNNPKPGNHGMEMFRDNLIKYLTLAVKPIIPASLWSILMEGVNTAFADYGFGAGLTPPAALTTSTIIKVVLGVFRDSVVSSNEAFMGPLFANIINGIKRSINPNGSSTLEEQKAFLQVQLGGIGKILSMTLGMSLPLDTIVGLIKDPSLLLDGLKQIISSIDLDNTIIDIWNTFYGQNGENESVNKALGTGDFLPALYKNIYSTDAIKLGLKNILKSTIIGEEKIKDILSQLPSIPDAIKPILGLLGNTTVSDIADWIYLEDPQTGYEMLRQNSQIIDVELPNGKVVKNNTIPLNKILSLITVKALGILDLNLGSLGIVPDDQLTTITYDPTTQNLLELDMDLLWYLDNYVFVQDTAIRTNNKESMELFGVNPGYFLQYATSSFTEIKDDYNQITLNENAGKIAIVNQAFLDENNKEVYSSSTLGTDLNDLSKIDNKYKINVSGVEYVIVGKDFTVDYMYPVINAENVTVNTKNQALVYVNQYGYDRIKRSNTASPVEKYFLFTTKNGQSPTQLQTILNNLVYKVATGRDYSGTNINSDSNTYKLAYLATESSLLNPERSLRISVIDDMIGNLEGVQLIVGVMLFVILAIVIMFVVRRYIGSRAKVLGILKAQGYSSWKIGLSICLFPLFVSIIGATLGYVVGLVLQFAVFDIFSIFWTIPMSTIPFNWLTFITTLIAPIILLCGLTILTTLFFLHKNKSIAMMNGSMEVNQTKFAKGINTLVSKTSVKNKFSISLALGSIGKLIALFISALFTAGVTLFFIASFNSFNKSIDKTYVNRNYKYMLNYVTPTYEGKNVQTFYINPSVANSIDVANMLYVPVGDPSEGYVYYADYFKPGYNSIINKDGANGDVSLDDTTTPHIFTKNSVDLTVLAGGLSINVWTNLYNSLPESQKSSVLNVLTKASTWLQWTQEGKEYQYDGKTYITRFVNFGQDDEYLSLWDNDINSFVQVYNEGQGVNQDIRVDYFKYESNEDNPENSKFVYEKAISNNVSYFSSSLIITGTDDSKAIRKAYRDFLVQGYNLMFAYNPDDKEESVNSLLNIDLRTQMPEYQLDYFISPGAIFMSYDPANQSNDETFTYLQATNVDNQTIQPQINGYSSNSKYLKIVDSSGNDLIKKAESYSSNEYYPLIVNKVVKQKYGYETNDVLSFKIDNLYDRYQNQLKDKLNSIDDLNLDLQTRDDTFKFKIIGISDTYINEEWITSHSSANKILGLNQNSYNGLISDSETPISIANSLPIYSYNGYWSADSKIYDADSVYNLSASELQRLINTYRQIFYNTNSATDSLVNNSLVATWLKDMLNTQDDNYINNIIKKFVGFQDEDTLDLKYSSDSIAANFTPAQKASSAIKAFTNIYTDNALYGSVVNAVSNGTERDYIENASSTVNDGMMSIIGIAFGISLTILVMITSMIINENERNIAIFGVLGYNNREKIRLFFSIYVPIVAISILASILIVWLVIPAFLSSILATTSILLPMSLSFVDVLIASGILIFVFAITCMAAWMIQGRVKPIMLLKEV